MNKVFLLLGGNLGERLNLIRQAKALIENNIGKLTVESSIYESESWGFIADQNFLNQVIEIESDLTAHEILLCCNEIEDKLGRTRRSENYESRTMDIDILFFNDEIIKLKDLQIPHPRLHERRFTLEPLVELIPDFNHPILNISLQSLLDQCKDKSEINKL